MDYQTEWTPHWCCVDLFNSLPALSIAHPQSKYRLTYAPLPMIFISGAMQGNADRQTDRWFDLLCGLPAR